MNDALKNLGRGVAGLGVLAAFVLCAIGAIGYLVADGRYLFSVATAVCLVFAAKPMYKLFQKLLL